MEANEFYDVWSDRNRPALRFVVAVGETVPSIFASSTLERFSSVRVTEDIANDVDTFGYCSFESDRPLHGDETLVRDSLSLLHPREEPQG